MLVNQEQGVLRDIGGKVHGTATDDDAFLMSVEGTDFDALVERVREIVDQAP